MDNKLNMTYTPTLDEFHNGFIYKLDGEDAVFKQQLNDIHPKRYTVKYLDEQDIIDLDFIIERNLQQGIVFSKNVISDMPRWYELELTYVNKLPFITLNRIDALNNQNANTTLIKDLHVKNVNELKWILNRYGVL